ncbi:MAG: molecular chaperone DnaK [Hyphomicrobiales bacterium]|nr:MAG: molecular chaperone DnaK [Hyphomicrobiales bacterium]
MAENLNQTQIQAFAAQLRQLKSELELASETTELDRAPVALDQQSVGRLSRMDAMQMQAMAQAQQRNREIDLRRVIGALGRIEDDEFGYCNDCGELIALKRLEVDPAASQCIKCAT